MTLAPHARALDSRQPSGVGVRVAIVIPCRNEAPHVAGMLNALRTQDSAIDDVIVVDGGSVDGTLELLRERPDIVLVRDADRGVYDGFNQGLAAATGDIVGFLNSDDIYEPGAFAAVGRALAENPDADAACGAALLEPSPAREKPASLRLGIGTRTPGARRSRFGPRLTLGDIWSSSSLTLDAYASGARPG